MFLNKQQRTQEITPESFNALAMEILHLTRMLEKLRSGTEVRALNTPRIQEEMKQLQELLQKKEFRRLPPEKRRELNNSLLLARNQILEAMQAVPPPTDRIQ